MPNVNGKDYPYTPAGIKAAKNAQLKKLANRIAQKSGTKKPVAPKPPVDRAFNKDRGGLNNKAKPIMTTLPSKSSKTKKK
tara:strand:+ start:5385 stop:5624 length:240 start_codon:yes stop_codon:yes gene_type:complete